MSYQFARIATVTNPNPTLSKTTMFSQTRARGYGEHPAIVRRRLIEDQRSIMQNEVSKDFQTNQHTEWEKKTEKIMQTNQIQRFSRQLKECDEELLNARRARLAAKLTAEDLQYRNEIEQKIENPQDRAKRLIASARKFKAERENKRASFASAALERQWKDSCDDLRTIDSKFFDEYCGIQVKQQIANKHEKKHELAAEERQWAEILESDRLEKLKKDEENKQKRIRDTIENREALKSQMQELSLAQKAARAQDDKEKEIFQQILAMDTKAAQQRAADELNQKREINRQNAADNDKLLRERKEKFERERDEERKDLESKLAAYREDTIRHENNIARQRADVVEFRNYLARRREEEQRMDKEMDRLVQEDLDRANSRRDLQWERERLAREKLMKDVYETRAKQVFERDQAKADEARDKEYQKAMANEESRRAAQQRLEESYMSRDAQARRKFDLQQQINLNQDKMAMAQESKMQEKMASDEAERLYQERLTKYKQQTIEQSAKNYGLKHAFNAKRPY